MALLSINDLKRHYDTIGHELDDAVTRVLSSGWYILGREVAAFEKEFAAFCGVSDCIGVANGTEALELALRALGVGTGDEVVTVANAGMYSTSAITSTGARPQFVDVNPKTLTMDVNSLKKTLSPRTTAIVVTHLYGRMADMPRLLAQAAKASAPVIEDCAQAHGALLDGKRAGSWGNIGCFSFYPTKNLGAMGDGGAVVTDDSVLSERLRRLRQYGWESKYHSVLEWGRNSRLDEVQAAILRIKLPYLDEWNARRRAIAQAYTKGLKDLDLILPASFGEDFVGHLYVLRSTDRDRLRAVLAAREISTDIHYPIPDYLQPSVQQSALYSPSLPNTEQASREVLTLPCFPEMTDLEVGQVIDAVRTAMAELMEDNA